MPDLTEETLLCFHNSNLGIVLGPQTLLPNSRWQETPHFPNRCIKTRRYDGHTIEPEDAT